MYFVRAVKFILRINVWFVRLVLDDWSIESQNKNRIEPSTVNCFNSQQHKLQNYVHSFLLLFTMTSQTPSHMSQPSASHICARFNSPWMYYLIITDNCLLKFLFQLAETHSLWKSICCPFKYLIRLALSLALENHR